MSYPIEFLGRLTISEQLLLLEVARQGLRDEIASPLMYDTDAGVDMLEDLADKIDSFMEEEVYE